MPYLKRNLLNWSQRHKTVIIAVLFIIILYVIFIPGCKFKDPYSTVITDQKGLLLGARVAEDGQWRFPPADTVTYKIEKSTLAFEDKYFFYHPGINPISVFRAILRNLKARQVVSGGSTITMQTIRLARKGKPRTVTEKILEMLMATRLELTTSKREILALYVSHAPYGGNVVGLEAASWRYYGTSSDQLSWAEAATLAILPNAPSLVHPGRNREILLNKRNRLLHKLFTLGWIDETTLQGSLAEGIPQKPNPMPVYAPHLLNRVFLSLPQKIVRTTLNASLQNAVTQIVESHHKQHKYNEIHNASAIIIEVESGNIIAYVGNCGYPMERNHSNEVDIILSPRSTGSLLKPLLFAAMIDDGKLLPGSLVEDIPMNLSGFSPRNYDGQFEGAVTAGRALSRSLNVPAVQLLRHYGIERFHQLIQALGMKTLSRPAGYYGLSLILGGAEGTLEDMSNIYASLSRVLNHYGETGEYFAGDYRNANFLYANNSVNQKRDFQAAIFNASSIWCTYQAMIEVNRPDVETGWQHFGSSRKIAWKTGTSFGYRDGWAIGTSTRYVVGVWIGNADGEGRPGLTGIATAAPLMFEIFGLLPDAAWFRLPVDEMLPAFVCRQSGYLAGPYCTDTVSLEIPMTGTKSPLCPFHKLVHVTADRMYRVNSDCYPVDSMAHLSWFVLPPVQEWFYKKHHSDYRRLPPFRNGCEPAGLKSMDLVYPRDEVRVYIPRGLMGEKGRVVFEAVHTDPDALIYWHLDNQFLSATRYIHQVELLPEAGDHQIVLVDEKGEELIRKFVVVEP